MQHQFFRFVLLVAIWIWAAVAHARVFSFSDSWMVAYLRGTGGMSNISDDAYAHSTGSNTTFDREVEYNFSGEIGLSLLMGEKLSVRFGVEGLKGQEVKTRGTLITDPNDTIDIESSVLAFSPVATIEYSYLNLGAMRLYGFAGLGYSTVTVTTEHTLSADSKTYYAHPANTYKETWEGDPTISYQLGTGFEYFTMDNVTISMDVGWRFFHVKEFSYKESATVIRGSTAVDVGRGDTVRDDGGHIIDLDMGGLFVGLMFKFYIPHMD